MAYRYRAPQRQQLEWAPACLEDLVAEDHLARFVVAMVDRMATRILHTRAPGACPGRPPFDPVMMFCVVLYAYATGTYSSRRIEASCHSDLAFRYLSGGLSPDHATIARYLVDRQSAMHALFVEGVRLLVAAGAIDLDTVAIDGTKIAANASLRANRTKAWIEDQVTAMIDATITSETTEAGEGGPKPLTVAGTRGIMARLSRLDDAHAVIMAEDAAEARAAEAAAQAARAEAAQGRQLRGRKPKGPKQRVARAEADHAAAQAKEAAYNAERAAKEQAAAERGQAMTRPASTRHAEATARTAQALAEAQQAAAEQPAPPRRANVTDADSRIMVSHNRYIQGYNTQTAVTTNGVILAQTVTRDANDTQQLEPMLGQIAANLAIAAPGCHPRAILADAGYWSEHNAGLPVPGELLIATLKDHKQRKAAQKLGTTTGPAPEGATLEEAMEHKLRTKEGAETYAKRSWTVEPVYGQIKEDRGFDRYLHRGLRAVQAEFSLVSLAHNTRKLFDHCSGRLAPA